MTRFGIRKRSRAGNTHSYMGPSWDTAGLGAPQKSFRSKAIAEDVARKLSEVNPVGFEAFSFEGLVKCHKCDDTVPEIEAKDLDWGWQYLPRSSKDAPKITRWFCPRHT